MNYTFIIIGIIILGILSYHKYSFLGKRKIAKKRIAEVIEYRKEKGPFRSDYTKLFYPYVKIKNNQGHSSIIKLSYANNLTKPFYIGEKIDVFFDGNDLLYWHGFSKGVYKFIPNL